MKKLFDKIEWGLILIALKNFEFPNEFINWISSGLSVTSFSILLNEVLMATSNQRQGDSLSSFLSIVGTEILSPPSVRGRIEEKSKNDQVENSWMQIFTYTFC